MKVLLILSVFIIGFLANEDSTELFQKFKNDHNKKYETYSEEMKRFVAFQENVAKIEEHNNRPGETWKMAITKFADMTEEEFKASVVGKGYIRTPKQESNPTRYTRRLDIKYHGKFAHMHL